MSRRAVIGGLVASSVGVAAAQGTGAFEGVTGERLFGIGTADDANALLGIEEHEATGRDGDEIDLVTLTNHSNTPLTSLSATAQAVGTPSVGVNVSQTPQHLEPGGAGSVTGTLSCTSAASNVPVELEISVSGPAESITATREITVSCDPPTGPEISAVSWRGGGINPIESPEDTPITVDIWYYNGQGDPGPGSDEIGLICDVDTTTNTNIRSDLPGQARMHVGVYIHESDESWHHPGFDPDDGEIGSWETNVDGVRWGDGRLTGDLPQSCDEDDDEADDGSGPPEV